MNSNTKEPILKEILSIRRRRHIPKNVDNIEVERFEEQVEKSLRRMEQERYLAKKFNYDELVKILKAYEEITSK
ncbi:MAG: hypothetical protein ACRCSG_06795 [Cellulosilyticaceae bacterium]